MKGNVLGGAGRSSCSRSCLLTLWRRRRRSNSTIAAASPSLIKSCFETSSSHGLLSLLAPAESIFTPLPWSSSSLGLHRFLNTESSSSPHTHTHNRNQESDDDGDEYMLQDKASDGESSEGWEEEDEREPEIGDGGDGGGIVLGDVPWGERALSIASEVLLQFGDDVKLFSFRTSRGYIYVRLDKLSNNYGCPSMEEIEKFSCLYKKQLEEVGESGQIPDNLALEVSSPGAERLLKVPDDLDRFRDMPMRVNYMEDDVNTKGLQKDGIFFLVSVETESEHCVWKLADVKENRDIAGKGRPLSRKQKDWRLRLPFGWLKRVTLYLEY